MKVSKAHKHNGLKLGAKNSIFFSPNTIYPKLNPNQSDKKYGQKSDVLTKSLRITPSSEINRKPSKNIVKNETPSPSNIQRKDDKDKKRSTTTVEVVSEHDFIKKESSGKLTTKSEAEEKVSDTVTKKTTLKQSHDKQTGTAELKTKIKKTGLFASASLKGESPTDVSKADTATFKLKVGGKWTVFKSDFAKIETGGSIEYSPEKYPALSLDGKVIFLPNCKIKPEVVSKLILNETGLSQSHSAGLSIKITEMLSAKAATTVDIDSGGNLKVKAGVGLILKF